MVQRAETVTVMPSPNQVMQELQVASQALHEERAVLHQQAAPCGSIFHEEAKELNNEARLMHAWRTEVNATLQDEVTTMRRVFVEDAEAHAARCAQVLSAEQ